MDTRLKEILLITRNKIILNSTNSIYDVFKNDLEKRISESKLLRDRCIFDSCNDISVKISIDGIQMNYDNGCLQTNQNQFLSDLDSTSLNELNRIVDEETTNIKKKMKYAISFNKSLMNQGYCMDEVLFNAVATLSEKEVKKISDEYLPLLMKIVGSNVSYYPLICNNRIHSITEKEVPYYYNVLRYYWSEEEFIPDAFHLSYGIYSPNNKGKRLTLLWAHHYSDYKHLTLGKMEDINSYMSNLMKSSEALSRVGITNLTIYFSIYDQFMDSLPERIPNKENLAVITKLVFRYSRDLEDSLERMSRYFTVVTDVLRFAAVLSNQSPTLVGVRFKSFSNPERRLIMRMLNHCQHRQLDFKRHPNLWSRLCERIHPTKFKNIYPELVEDLLGAYRLKKEIKKDTQQIQSYKIILELYRKYKSKFENEATNDITENNENGNAIVDAGDEAKLKNASEKILKYKPSKEIVNTLEALSRIFAPPHSAMELNSAPKLSAVETRVQEIQVNLSKTKNDLLQYKRLYGPFNTRVEYLLNQGELEKGLNLLSKKPGEFCRCLDRLLTKVNDHEKVLQLFEKIASKTSVKVLLSVKGYFQKRYEKLDMRVFIIKDIFAPKIYYKKEVKKELERDLCERICRICEMALITLFSEREKMNGVYINPDFKKYIIPIDLRSANPSLESYSKGSHFSMNYRNPSREQQELSIKLTEEEIVSAKTELQETHQKIEQLKEDRDRIVSGITNSQADSWKIKTEIEAQENKAARQEREIQAMMEKLHTEKKEVFNKKVRLFIWWTNTFQNKVVDIDLSVMIFDKDLNRKGHVSFTRLCDCIFSIYHSGDIRNGGPVNGKGAAEFIDFDPKEIVKAGGRYIAVSVISYSGIKFGEMENCKFGWMERERLRSSEFFEPKAVRQKLDLQTNTTSTIPVIFDCVTREIIWVDTPLTQNNGCVRIENFNRRIKAVLYYYLNPLRDNIYNLIKLHIQARDGQQIESESELRDGDIAFVNDYPYHRIEGVTYIRPTDLDIILSEYIMSEI